MSSPESNQAVQDLVMEILGGAGTPDTIKRLQVHAHGHSPSCATSADPSCTCGYEVARNFTRLFDGRVQGAQLLRGRFGTNEGDDRIYRQFTDIHTLLC